MAFSSSPFSRAHAQKLNDQVSQSGSLRPRRAKARSALWRLASGSWVAAALACASLALPSAGHAALSQPGTLRTIPDATLAAAVLPPGNPPNTPVPGGSAYAANCSDVVQLPPFVASASSPDGGGYWLAGADGGVFGFGDAAYQGSVPGLGVHVGNIVAMAPTPDGGGYWIVGSDGGVFSFGDATYHGSVPALGIHVNDIVGIAPSAGGAGYWIVGSDGGVFSFGNAQFHGAAAGTGLKAPIVSIAAVPGGGGYWLAGSDGGVFSYGNAGFYGSAGNVDLKRPVVSISAVPGGGGYWLVGSDGGVFSYGNAGFYGSTGNMSLSRPIVSITPTPGGGGYWLVGSDGGVFSFGAARFAGSIPPELLQIAPPTQCDQEWLAAIDSGRQAEGIGPMSLPSNWNALSPGEQIFVASNLERTARGEPPAVGLANVLNVDAQQGAQSVSDPGLAPSFGGYPVANGGPGGQFQEAGIWAADSQNQGVLEAVWAWMYDDGPGGMNWSCPSSGGSGCWTHRDIILGQYTGTSDSATMMGVGWAPGAGGWAVSETAILADFSGPLPPESFAWSQEAPYIG